MNIDKPTKFIKNVSVIIGIVIGGYYGMVAIFATQTMVIENKIEDIESDIDNAEKLRDHYQYIDDLGERELTSDEARRMRVTSGKLDRLYSDLERKQDQLQELKRY